MTGVGRGDVITPLALPNYHFSAHQADPVGFVEGQSFKQFYWPKH